MKLPSRRPSRKMKMSTQLTTSKKKHRSRQHQFASAASFAIFLILMLLKRYDGKKVAVDVSQRNPTSPDLARGKKIGHVVTAPDLYKAYQEIQHEYHQKAFDESQRWKILNSKDGVEIAMLQHESDPLCPYVRMTAIMPTPVEECWNFLRLANWETTMPKMDPFYEGLSVFGEYRAGLGGRVHMILARKRTKRILAFGKRDFVFVSVSDIPRGDGVWVSGTVSVITKQVPRRKGYTRAYQDSIAFYEPLQDNTKTKMTIVCRIDLNDHSDDGEGGNMPMWLYKKTIGSAGANSVKSMRYHLQFEHDQRKQKEELEISISSFSSKRGKFNLPWKKNNRVEQDDVNSVFEFESLEDINTGDTTTRTVVSSRWKAPRLGLPWKTQAK